MIGAGFGGLAAALRLSAAGHRVTVLERAAEIGGKARTVEVAGRAIDAGPTVFTMRWVFEDLFRTAGLSLDDHVRLTPARVLARHAWPDGSRLDLFADLEESAQAIGAFAGSAEAARYRDFAARTGRAYDLFRDSFIAASRPNPISMLTRLGPAGTLGLLDARPAANMYAAIADMLQDDRLRQLFARYATYCGSSPFRAPGTLMLIAHVERLGVWQVAGGMKALAAAIGRAVEISGGAIRTGAEVERIESTRDRVSGVRLADGEVIEADAVVFAGDVGALGQGLLGPSAQRAVKPTQARDRSLSALVFSAVARPRGFPLAYHTVFFGPDYRGEFDALADGRLPRDPTTYVCALDRSGDHDAPAAGDERLHILVNAPAIGDIRALEQTEIETCRSETEALMAKAGLTLSLDPATTRITTPVEFHRRFPGTGGALYGAATHGPVASFRRATSATRLAGLVLAGGSVHPGAGVPMATLSGALAATLAERHLARVG